MTPQEQELLISLTQRVNQTQLQEKDPDAENLLGHELGSNPDALYILAQTVLVQNIALSQAQAQVAQLKQQLQQAKQPAHATSFLGSLLGYRDPEPPPPPPPPQADYSQQNPQYMPVPPQYAQPAYQQPQYIPAGPPSFLRGAMQTAAGVAAGALAFEGVESILHGMGGHGGYGWAGPGMGLMGPGLGMGMGGGFERPVEGTIVNNYYDQPGGHEGGEHRGLESAGGETVHHGDAQLSNASYDSSSSNLDTAASDDNSSDNLAGFDDRGSDDVGNLDDGGAGFDDGGGDFGGDSGNDLL